MSETEIIELAKKCGADTDILISGDNTIDSIEFSREHLFSFAAEIRRRTLEDVQKLAAT